MDSFFYNRNLFLKFIANNLHSTDVIYDKDNILIIRVKSFNDCRKLFDREGINWCIAKDLDFWDKYVSKLGNEQYFIIDFNKIKSVDNTENNLALIGITTRFGEIFAAHAKNDKDLISNLTKILVDKKLHNFVIMNNFGISTMKKLYYNTIKLFGG